MVHLLADLLVQSGQLGFEGCALLLGTGAIREQRSQHGLTLGKAAAVFGLGSTAFLNLLAVGGHTLIVDADIVLGTCHTLLAEAGKGLLGLHVLAGRGNGDEEAGLLNRQAIHAILGISLFIGFIGAEGAQLLQSSSQCLLLGGKVVAILLVALVLTKDLLAVLLHTGDQGLVGLEIGLGHVEASSLSVHQDTDKVTLILKRSLLLVGLLEFFAQGRESGLGLGHASIQTLDLALQTLDLRGTGQSAVVTCGRTTRKRTADVDLLTVQRDHADAVAQGLSHSGGVIDVIKDHSATQERGNDVREAGIGRHKGICHRHVARKACGTLHLVGLGLGAHRGQREEGGTTRVLALQGVHSGLGGRLVLHHDVLQVCAKSGLHGGDVLVLNRNDGGERAVDLAAGCTAKARDATLAVLLHDELYATGITLKLFLHGAVGVDALVDRIATKLFAVEAFVRIAVLLVEGDKRTLGRGDLLGQGVVFFVISIKGFLVAIHFPLQLSGGIFILLHLREDAAASVTIRIAGILQDRDAHLDVHQLLLAQVDVLARGSDLLVQAGDLGLQTLNLGSTRGRLTLKTRKSLLQLTAGGAVSLQLGTVCLQLAHESDTALPGGGDHFLGVCHGGLGHAVFAIQLMLGRGGFGDASLQLLGGCTATLGHFGKTAILHVQGLQGLIGLLQVEVGAVIKVGGLCDLACQTLGVIEPQTDVCTFFGFQEGDTAAGLPCLALQRADLGLYLGKNVAQAHEIGLGIIQLTLGLVFLDTVLSNTRCVLKNRTALLALAGDHVGNTALSDDGVAVATDTRIKEQLIDVAQTDGLAVDEILTLARTEIAAGDRDLVIGTIQVSKSFGVIKGYRNLGVTHGAAAIGTAENNVLHLATAQGFGGDLTQHPTHRVGNVGFTASVRADNDGNA